MDFANHNALTAYLRRVGLVAVDEPIAIQPLTGGVSSDVVRIVTPRQRFVLKQALPQLKVKEDWRADTRRNCLERLAMEAIGTKEASFVPKILYADDQETLYAMEDIPGALWKQVLLDGQVDSDIASALGRFLARVHRMGSERPHWIHPFDDKSLFYELRISPYFEFLQQRYPAWHDDLASVIGPMMESAVALVHGDFSPKNILLRPLNEDRVQPVVLDWEVTHVGHPSFDIGFMVNHLLLKAIHAADAAPYVQAAQRFYAAYFDAVEIFPEMAYRDITMRTVGALMWARIDGKSPVEYLRVEEREPARQLGIALLRRQVTDWNDVVGYLERSKSDEN